MAFWGVEVKPGKPYTHQFDETRGRLHISQATLGIGASSKKSLLQINVGDNSPVLLCSLLPDKTESCQLDLEFEEEEDVVFSVIGPRSVHLGGYYLGSSCAHDHGDGDESDSYGEDIGESENESSDFDSEEYEDDFIDDDDDDIEMFSASPRPKSGVVIEELPDDENTVNENGDGKQLIVGGRSSTIESESEDEDGFPVSSSEVQGKHDKTEEKSAEVQEKPGKKVSKKSNKKSEKGDDRVTGSKRKSQDDQDGKAERVIEKTESSLPTSEVEQESARPQKKKKKKERVKEAKTHGVGDASMVEADKANTVNITKDEPAENMKPSTDKSVEIDAGEDTTGKKKKKKKNKKNKTPEGETKADGEETKKGSVVKVEDKKAEVKPTQERNYPNGLVVEELAMGKPDGKRASPGTKVSVRYIGKLKKNGKIFDSNINRAPFQFRLGVGEVIKGWDVGVNGMRVGDKRKLTIPPSMGYGSKGAGPKIPPNAWLEFDVELLGVR